ncbi:hypothetical protein [Microcoleus sp. D2_18a_B4]|uniref:hypothetical protein n=1 Tax=Microcoleus sp. D2_18a_B4 TaxID=3055329 RepID=UPI002FD0DE40
MDIATLKKKLESTVLLPREGESWEFVLERQRELKPTRTMFWRVLIRTLSKFLVKVYSVSLSANEKLALVIAFGFSEILDTFWVIPVEVPGKVELPRYECDRGPPESFVPFPDAEIGGCARNDSLIAPLVN